ncbi:hypothetical protein HJFPF1_04963 [Paramyrothecium foliicola]|nr:hypothetical protein HJFPF1_04963 [Paramyrothecium foliicola]
MVLPSRIAARVMADADRGFRVPVWKYTYATGKGAGEIFLHSPKVANPVPGTLALRQINSEAVNKVWIAEDPTQFKRCDGDGSEEILDDAHGIILHDGWAQKLHDDESAGSVSYKRGDRIWVERSLSPGQKALTKVPVINLDSLASFEMPIVDICFIAQLAKTDDEENLLAVAVGPIVNYYFPKRKRMAQLFIVWPADEPNNIEQAWESWDKGDKKTTPKKRFLAFRRLDIYEEQWQIFRLQWSKLNRRYANQLMERGQVLPSEASALSQATQSQTHISVEDEGDEEEEDDDDVGDDESYWTDSSSSSGELNLHWEAGPIDKTNCCNMSPRCTLQPGEADLVPSYIGGLQEIEHYHIQDEDIDECPQGASHKSHCILRNNRSQCVFSHDQINHTCCKLRANPPLPGVNGAIGDSPGLLWERLVSDDHFVDFTQKIRTRTELVEGRDAIPPVLQGLYGQYAVRKRRAALKREWKKLGKQHGIPEKRRPRHHPYARAQPPAAIVAAAATAITTSSDAERGAVEPTLQSPPVQLTLAERLGKGYANANAEQHRDLSTATMVTHPGPLHQQQQHAELCQQQEQTEFHEQFPRQFHAQELQQGPACYQQVPQQPPPWQAENNMAPPPTFSEQLFAVDDTTSMESGMDSGVGFAYNMAVSPAMFWTNLAAPVTMPDSGPVPFVPAAAIMPAPNDVFADPNAAGPVFMIEEPSLSGFGNPQWYTHNNNPA